MMRRRPLSVLVAVVALVGASSAAIADAAQRVGFGVQRIGQGHSDPPVASAIVTARLDGSHRRLLWGCQSAPGMLAGVPTQASCPLIGPPRFSMDASAVAVTVVDGSNWRLATMPTQSGAALTTLDVVTNAYAEPAWSPDGRRIAYAGPGSPSGSDISVVDADGGQATKVAHCREAGVAAVAWSSRDEIAWVCRGRVEVAPLAGGPVRRLVRAASELSWSPDGRTLAIARGASLGERRLFLVRADGTHLRPLVANARVHGLAPSWSPRGDRIAFLRVLSGLRIRGAVVRRDGTGLREAGFRTAPDWLRATR